MRIRLLPLSLLAVLGTAATASAQEAAGAPTTPAQPEARDESKELLKVSDAGLTSDQVGKRAAQTSYTAKANEEALRAAAARVDQAWASFLPRLSGLGRYTRLSDFAPPSFTVAPGTPPITFPGPVLDNWLLQATLIVPISDYFLRINQNYTSATASQAAARYDVAAARAKSAADGRSVYYQWLYSRGSLIVAQEALEDSKSRATDVKNQFTVGNVSKADVLRADTAVANGEFGVVQAKNGVELWDKQLRLAMHAREGEVFLVGENLDASLPPITGNLADLVKEAHSARLELKGIDANVEAIRKQASVMRAGAYPQFSAFADAIYANPNQRKFPQTNDWFPTWDLGLQLTWSPNDVLTSLAAGRSSEAQAAQLEAQKLTMRDGIEFEVTGHYLNANEADQALATAKRELASAIEAARVARELFNAGRATAVTVTDAETDLTRARLHELNAKTNARLSRVRLEHALGRDTKDVQTQ